MTQKVRIRLAVRILVVLVAGVLGLEALRRQPDGSPVASTVPTLAPGAIPIYLNGQLVAGFIPTDLEQLTQVSFTDAEEGKLQEGWLLRDVLLLHLKPEQLQPETRITVISNSRNKSAQLTWTQVNEPTNNVMFDLSNRGTLKLASVLANLNTRDEWIQDVDRIEVTAP